MATVMINDNNDNDDNNKKEKKERGGHCILLISDKW